jgi:hypothetical protein
MSLCALVDIISIAQERSECKCLSAQVSRKWELLCIFRCQSLEADVLESNPPYAYAIWSIWTYLPILQHLFCEALCAVGIYFIFSAAVIMERLRAMTSLPQNEDIPSFQRAVAALHKRCTNVQWLIRELLGFIWAIGIKTEASSKLRTAAS